MHHRRKRPKSGRAGCLLCKPHKRQGSPLDLRAKPSDLNRLRAAEAQLREARPQLPGGCTN